ncbi:TIGR02302 family protein [Shumkonia mesophila]|uniref:TIGR02302 family protein n=1 Tax=Shumkonia mesophila TaxID=2838854 RepID=UPI0029343996|nr:TIGR02302 family protein [Shumkonia mesophila]
MTAPRRRGYFLLLRMAGAAILWERLWPRLWPATLVAGIFLTLALFGAFPALPAWLHIGLLAVFVLGFAATLYGGMRSLKLPGHDAARARVERDSGLVHRPLTTLEDNLTAGLDDPISRGLWQTHRARMAAGARSLRLRPPSPGLLRFDPWALRAALVLLLVVAAAMAGGDAPTRLKAAVLPHVPGTPAAPVTAEIWITPPAYTRMAPLFLNAATPVGEPLAVPAGSVLMAQVTGTAGTPSLDLGTAQTPFAPISPDPAVRSYRLETTIQAGDRLRVEAGLGTLAEWPMRVIPDTPPTARFSAPPEATEQAHLRLPIEAADDYGLKEVALTVSRSGRTDPPEKALRLSVPLPGQAARQIKLPYVRDLTAHLWAGQPVILSLAAEDVAGQRTVAAPVETVLPERAFRHPAARAIIAERRKLADPSDAVRAEVAAGLAVISSVPRLFSDDVVVSLALGLARARLIHDSRDAAIGAVAGLLWDIALRLEDGSLTVAERQWQRAQERLMEALRQGAESPEIQKLLDELEQALADFMKEMADEMARMGAMDMPLDPDAQFIDSSDLQRMVDEIREMAQAGALDAARQRLAELKQMLENLRAGVQPGGPQQQQQQRQNAEAQKMMEALRQLAQRQQELLEKTFREGRQGQQQPGPGQQRRPGQGGQPQPGQQPGEGEGQGEGDAMAALQEALRRDLGNLMLQFDSMMGSIPGALGEAERAMRRASEALRGSQMDPATQAQTEALQHLRSGAQDAARQMARQMAPGPGGQPGRFVGQRPVMPMGRQPDRDPFGRPAESGSGFSANDSVDIPDAMDLRRAHEIVRELRRRAGERARPQFERDYIERLLRQF